MQPNVFRQIALSFPEAEEKAHFERASFRVRNKIFATLDENKNTAVFKLSIPDQTALVSTQPDTFFLEGWSHQGWTFAHLDQLNQDTSSQLLKSAWLQVAPKRLIQASGL